jgi:ABC-2 type transport system ATP-binding protein
VKAVAEPVLSARNLAKRYGQREVLRDVGFDLSAGEVVAVVGPNGAGKTTLLSILAGIQRASAGSVSTPHGGAERRRAIGWVPQQPALYSKLSAAANLRLFAHLERLAEPERAAAEMLEQTGLGERAHEPVERLSGGNRQRVNVALGLVADPLVLVLDEPSSALDPPQRARLWELVHARASRGTSVLFSTHHLGEVRRYATRAIVLADGALLFDGHPQELVATSRQGEDYEAAFVAFLKARGH